MKKTYINPTIEVVEVAVEAGIAQSGETVLDGMSDAGDLTLEDEI